MNKETLKNYDLFYSEKDWKNVLIYTKLIIKVNLKILKVYKKNNYITILDAGCGTGLYSFIFNKLGYKIKGFDFSKTAIEHAKKKYPQIDFRVIDGFHLNYTEKFDLIFAKGFSPFNTTNFEKTNKLIDYWNRYINNKGNILIITRTNFTETKPTGWYNLSENDIKKIYSNNLFDKQIVYLYSKFRILVLLLPNFKFIIRLLSTISKKIIAKIFKIPVSVIIILSKK